MRSLHLNVELFSVDPLAWIIHRRREFSLSGGRQPAGDATHSRNRPADADRSDDSLFFQGFTEHLGSSIITSNPATPVNNPGSWSRRSLPVTQSAPGPLALAILLMGIRRSYSLCNHFVFGQPIDSGAETIGLVISVLMLLGLFGLRRGQHQQPFSPEAAPIKLSSVVQINLAKTALFLGGVTIIASCVVGYLAYESSRKALLDSIFNLNSSMARNVALQLQNQAAPEDDDKLASMVETAWNQVDKLSEKTYICMINPQGTLLLHTISPDFVGRDISSKPFLPVGASGPSSIGELLKSKKNYSGFLNNSDGQKQAISFMYLPNFDVTLAVHTPASEIEAEIRRDIIPWAAGLAFTTFLLLPLALGLLFWSYSTSLSQRQEAELSLQESEQRYRTLAEVSPVGIFHTDAFGHCLYVNQRWSDITGVSLEDALGTGWAEGLHPDDRQRVFHQWDQAMTEHRPFQSEYRFRLSDGKITWVIGQAEATTDTSGEITGYVGTLTDITERKYAADQFRSLLESAPDAMVIVNSDGRIVLVNQQMKTVFGYSRDELLGQPVEMLIPKQFQEKHPQLRTKYFEEPSSRPMGKCLNLFARRKDGREFSVEVRLSPIHTEKGILVTAAVRDITERNQIIQDRITAQEELLEHQSQEKERVQTELKKVQVELIRSTRLATIGQMSAQIAHDIRNPLGAVSNAVFYLRRKVPLGEGKWKDYLELIQSEVNACGQIISNMLSLNKEKRPELKETDLRNVVKGAIDRLHVPTDIHVQLNCPDDPLLVNIDPIQLRQVLDNLLENSMYALKGQGEITLSIRRTESFDEIDIQDSGPGIPQDVRDSLFEPFVTSKSKGTGLGLAICRQIIEHHQGSIELVDTDNQHTTFRIQLPRESNPLSSKGNS